MLRAAGALPALKNKPSASARTSARARADPRGEGEKRADSIEKLMLHTRLNALNAELASAQHERICGAFEQKVNFRKKYPVADLSAPYMPGGYPYKKR